MPAQLTGLTGFYGLAATIWANFIVIDEIKLEESSNNYIAR